MTLNKSICSHQKKTPVFVCSPFFRGAQKGPGPAGGPGFRVSELQLRYLGSLGSEKLQHLLHGGILGWDPGQRAELQGGDPDL